MLNYGQNPEFAAVRLKSTCISQKSHMICSENLEINPIAIYPLFGLRGGGVDFIYTFTADNSKAFGF